MYRTVYRLGLAFFPIDDNYYVFMVYMDQIILSNLILI